MCTLFYIIKCVHALIEITTYFGSEYNTIISTVEDNITNIKHRITPSNSIYCINTWIDPQTSFCQEPLMKFELLFAHIDFIVHV